MLNLIFCNAREFFLTALIGAMLATGAFAADKKADKNAAPANAESTRQVSLAADSLPKTITDADIDGSNPEFLAKYSLIEVFPQKISLAPGSFSDGDGKAITFRNGEQMIIAFYSPAGGGYSLVGNPTVLSSVLPVRMSVHPDFNVPCLVVKRINDNHAWRVFVRDGLVSREEFVDETDLSN